MENLIRDYYNKLQPDEFDFCFYRTPGATSCQSCFQNQFFDGNTISYECPEKRKLYLLRYFSVHASENQNGMRYIPKEVIDTWFESGVVRILSLGGGPGSDIYGILKFLKDETELRNDGIDIILIRVDIEGRWDDTFDDVMKRFFPGVRYQCIQLDVRHDFPSDWEDCFDLVTVSYLISELCSDTCIHLADEIDAVLDESGVLMINDRPEECVERNARAMFEFLDIYFKESYLSDWAGFSYPNEIAREIQPSPKFSMNSSIFVGVRK